MKEAKNKDVFTYLLWGVIIQVVAGFMIPPLYRLITGPAADKATELVLTSAVYSIVLFVMFYRLKWCPLSPDYVRGKHWDVLLTFSVLKLDTFRVLRLVAPLNMLGIDVTFSVLNIERSKDSNAEQ